MAKDKITGTGKVQFIDNHLPVLATGNYTITVEQQITIPNSTQKSEINETFKLKQGSQKFSVLGPRFNLDPQEILAVYPPPGSLGEHSDDLPHIILNRSTLPWERSATGDKKTPVPWLTLLLFDEGDFTDKQTFDQIKNPVSRKLSELKSGEAFFPTVTKESGDHDDDLIKTIDVPKYLLNQILPSLDEIRILAHVRQTTDSNDTPQGDEDAVIICNRLPKQGSMSIVHLVSIEGRYEKKGFDFQDAKDTDSIRLVSLYNWRFACISQEHTFTGLLSHLDSGVLRLTLPEITNKTANEYLSMGCVPLHHEMRQGKKSVSWYHGPFITGNNTKNCSSTVCSADALVLYNQEIGMFDISYSAAWELGRLHTLQNKQVSVNLFNWKRSHAQSIKDIERQLDHIPFGSPTAPNLPESIRTWFEALAQLKGIPFNYLVPDERMLPTESIRFFQVDPVWVECLRDGAFSIGRVLSSDHTRDKIISNNVAQTETSKMSGFLLRSEVVAGWPGLLVDGYNDTKAEPKDQIKLIRMESLSKNMLICLFEDIVRAVDIHLKPETLHFGVDRPDNSNTPWRKTKRNEKGEETSGSKIDVPFKTDGDRIIDITELETKLGTNTSSTSSEFAFQMIEGVEKVRFICQ